MAQRLIDIGVEQPLDASGGSVFRNLILPARLE
jgi:hypothetical protein